MELEAMKNLTEKNAEISTEKVLKKMFDDFSTERLVRLLFIMSDKEEKARIRLRAARVCGSKEAFAEAWKDTAREFLAVEVIMQELNRRGVDV